MSVSAEPLLLRLVLPDGTRVPITQPITIGRGENADVRLTDQTVSRLHARIAPSSHGAALEDAGSRFGTWMDGKRVLTPTPIDADAEIRLGDVNLTVESVVPEAIHETSLGETVVVPIGATSIGLRPAAVSSSGVDAELRPRVRSGWALKRTGPGQAVLRELTSGRFIRMDRDDAALFERMNGSRTVSELLAEAELMLGPVGPARLVRLVVDLGDRGLLDGVDAVRNAPAVPSRLAHALRPRDWPIEWVPAHFERAYRHWAHVLFARRVSRLLALLSLAGVVTFGLVMITRDVLPFSVGRAHHRLLIGAAIFVIGRFLLAAWHEQAHGLALAHYHRRASRAGLRVLLIFPYAFVDTSEAYFEPSERRVKIAAAGPASDLTLAAVFAIGCAAIPGGPIQDVLFQLAFAGYVGAFLNLNPLLDRDGYQILSELLDERALRQRARRHFADRLAGRRPPPSRVLTRYGVAGALWSLFGAAFAAGISLAYMPRLDHVAPHPLVLAVFIGLWTVLLVPAVAHLGLPLAERARMGPKEVNRVIR